MEITIFIFSFTISLSINNDNIKSEIKKLLMNNEKLKALKLYKESTGKSLLESKDYIDKLYCKLKCKNDNHTDGCLFKSYNRRRW
jgi:tmRNA-binding protein